MLNWSNTHQICEAETLFHVQNESELLQALYLCRGRKFRLVGSAYSNVQMLEIKDPEERVLCVTMKGIVRVEPDHVVFWAGTQLKDAYVMLTELNRMFVCHPGVISEQTVAGAVATGTHGQGMNQCSISDAVCFFRFFTPGGYVYEIDASHPWMPAMRLNLGSLGIVTQVGLRTVPYTEYVCWKRNVNTSTFIQNYEKWNSRFELVKTWWFIDDDHAHVWLSNSIPDTGPESHANVPFEEVPDISNFEVSLNLDDTIDKQVKKMQIDTKTTDAEADQFRTVNRFRSSATVTGSIYDLWCKGIPVPQINVEICIPLERFQEACLALMEMTKLHQDRTHYPIILRSTGSSSTWLSSGYDRRGCHFGFVAYMAQDGTVSDEGTKFILRAETYLASIGGRPHWGKYYTPRLYHWSTLYPRFADFKKLRDVLDPHHRLTNDFMSKLLTDSNELQTVAYCSDIPSPN